MGVYMQRHRHTFSAVHAPASTCELIVSALAGDAVTRVIKVLAEAVRARFRRTKRPAGAHWLDAAVPRYGRGAVREVRALLGVLTVFIPVPMFWTLFDQTASRCVHTHPRGDTAPHRDTRVGMRTLGRRSQSHTPRLTPRRTETDAGACADLSVHAVIPSHPPTYPCRQAPTPMHMHVGRQRQVYTHALADAHCRLGGCARACAGGRSRR
jgi:hypothetical protein